MELLNSHPWWFMDFEDEYGKSGRRKRWRYPKIKSGRYMLNLRYFYIATNILGRFSSPVFFKHF